MARAFIPAPPARNRYRDLLAFEREHAHTWHRHDTRLLDDLEAGRPVLVWGYLAGTNSPVARLHPDGTATPLTHGDPDAVAFLERTL